MKTITPISLTNLKQKIKEAAKIAAQGNWKVIRVRVSIKNPAEGQITPLNAILTATNGIIWYNTEISLRAIPDFQGIFYLDIKKLKKDKEQAFKEKQEKLENKLKGIKTKQEKQNSFDIEPLLIHYTDFPKIEIKKPSNYFTINKENLLNGLKIISSVNKEQAEIRVFKKTALLKSSALGVKNRFHLKIEKQNRNYGRIVFNPQYLKTITENITGEIAIIKYQYPFIAIQNNFMACINTKN